MSKPVIELTSRSLKSLTAFIGKQVNINKRILQEFENRGFECSELKRLLDEQSRLEWDIAD